MNAGTILKVEYRLDGETPYTELDFSGFSASFESTVTRSAAGYSFHLQLGMKIPRISRTVSDTLGPLVGQKLNIRFTDGNQMVHTAGNSSYPARMTYREEIQGTPGGWNGYEVTITQESPYPHTISEA